MRYSSPRDDGRPVLPRCGSPGRLGRRISRVIGTCSPRLRGCDRSGRDSSSPKAASSIEPFLAPLWKQGSFSRVKIKPEEGPKRVAQWIGAVTCAEDGGYSQIEVKMNSPPLNDETLDPLVPRRCFTLTTPGGASLVPDRFLQNLDTGRPEKEGVRSDNEAGCGKQARLQLMLR